MYNTQMMEIQFTVLSIYLSIRCESSLLARYFGA